MSQKSHVTHNVKFVVKEDSSDRNCAQKYMYCLISDLI